MDDVFKEIEKFIMGEEGEQTVGDLLSSAEERFACGMIGLFGGEEHTAPDADCVRNLDKDYVIECMEKALKSNVLYEGGVGIAKEIIAKLKK